MSILTLAAARAQLNYADDDISDDTEIQTYVDAITGVVEDYKGEVIDPRAVVENLELCGEDEFWLSSKPVISLTSLISLDGLTTWDVTTMVVRSGGQVLVKPSNLLPWGDAVATYQAGYAVAPGKYARGGAIILQHVWQTQRGAGLGAANVTESADPLAWIVPQARELLGKPRPGWG